MKPRSPRSVQQGGSPRKRVTKRRSISSTLAPRLTKSTRGCSGPRSGAFRARRRVGATRRQGREAVGNGLSRTDRPAPPASRPSHPFGRELGQARLAARLAALTAIFGALRVLPPRGGG